MRECVLDTDAGACKPRVVFPEESELLVQDHNGELDYSRRSNTYCSRCGLYIAPGEAVAAP